MRKFGDKYTVRFKKENEAKWFELHLRADDPWEALRIAQQLVKDPQEYRWKID